MRWGKKFIPEGVREFDYCFCWYFAWLPTWDNVRFEWVWLEKIALQYYWTSDGDWKGTWMNYNVAYHTCVYDCRSAVAAQQEIITVRLTNISLIPEGMGDRVVYTIKGTRV